MHRANVKPCTSYVPFGRKEWGTREETIDRGKSVFLRVSNFLTATILTRSFRYFRSLRFLIFYETIDVILFSSFLSFLSTDDRIKVDKVQFVSEYIFVLSPFDVVISSFFFLKCRTRKIREWDEDEDEDEQE